MLKPSEEKLLNNLDELYASGVKISYLLELFDDVRETSKYKQINESGQILRKAFLNNEDFAKHRVAYPEKCQTIAGFNELFLMQNQKMYKIQKPIFRYSIALYTGPFSPFLNHFKRLMDLSFAAGLPHYWEILYRGDLKLKYDEFIFYDKQARKNNSYEQIDEEKLELDLESIAPFFVILAIGLLLALFLLLCEIFYHDFLSELKFSIMDIKEFLRRKICRNIDVRPAKYNKNIKKS